MSKLTVVILTKNEEKNIIDVVQNAKRVTEDVLIIDSGSTDGTCELAKEQGARVVFRAWDNDFSAQRNFALEQTTAAWVLYLDADERLGDKQVQAIREILQDTKPAQYALIRKSVAFGQEFNHGVLKPDCVYRMFLRENVHWVNKVHERPECKDPMKKLPGYTQHFTYPDWHSYFNKFNQYTTIWAENAYANGKRTSFLGALAHGLGGFIQMGIFKLGFLDGWLGFVLTINHFLYTYTKYIKLIDLQRKNK